MFSVKISNKIYTANYYLDAKTLNCPLPILYFKKIYNSMKQYETVVAEGTDPSMITDFDDFIKKNNAKLIKFSSEQNVFKYVVERIERNAENKQASLTGRKRESKPIQYLGVSPEDEIYRYMKADRLFDIFKTKFLILARPCIWDDPFEDILSRSVLEDKQGGVSKNLSGLSANFFAQCWSKNPSCDGIWKNYATLDYGAKIVSSVGRISYLFNNITHPDKGALFIGEADYVDISSIQETIINLRKNWANDVVSTEYIAKTLLKKRIEFSYEKEVRIIYFQARREDLNLNNTLSIRVEDINNIIESIEFSPRMHNMVFEAFKDKLQQLGFKNIISKSCLYES
jgi:TusA-related sulfurtransferase